MSSLMTSRMKHSEKDECVFCDVVRSFRLRPDVELESFDSDGPTIFSFEPLNPVTLGHRLFVPLLHTVDAAEEPYLTGRVFALASRYAYKQGYQFNLITSAGEDATQSIFHLHVHYVPRRENDGLLLPWSDVPDKEYNGL